MKLKGRIIFMKKFIITSLAIAILTNFSPISFALSAKVKSNLCSATLVKPSKYPWVSKDMQAGCLGIVEVKIKDTNALMPNMGVQVETKEEPLHYSFNPFNLSTFLRKTPKRKEFNKFMLDGVKEKACWYNIPKRFWNWMVDKRVPVEYRLLPISKEDAKVFFTKDVKEGEKKLEKKTIDDFNKKIVDQNGKSNGVKLSEEMVKRALAGLQDPNVDQYDPYNTVENGNIFKFVDYKEPINVSHFYSKKEADEKNKAADLQKNKICDSFVDKSESDLKKYGLVATLSAEKPIQHLAVVVNNNIEDKPEAYKLFNLLALNGYDFLHNDKSTLEFSIQKVFKMPEDGKPIDEEKLSEVESLINSTKEKPGMYQWFKNLGNLTLKTIDSVLPQFMSDFIKASWSGISNGFRKTLDIMNKVEPKPKNNEAKIDSQQQESNGMQGGQQPAQPAQQTDTNDGAQGGQPQTTQAASALQPVINVNVVNMPVGQQKIEGDVNITGDVAHGAAEAEQPGAALDAP